MHVTVGRIKGGKSTNGITEILSMITGRGLLGIAPTQPLRVWYIGEDPMEELDLRFGAAFVRFGIVEADLGDRLFVDSVVDGNLPKFRIAEMENRAATINEEVVEQLIAVTRARQIDVLYLDPLIKFHAVPESDNVSMEVVMGALARVAAATNCAIELLHHVRKPGAGGPITATIDDGRGASAVISAVRSARVVNRMTAEEATKAGIAPKERWRYFRLDSENNTAPPEADIWRQLVTVVLPCGEHVGVCDTWRFPNPFENLTVSDLESGADLARSGAYRASSQSDEWYGFALAKALDIPVADNPANLAKIKEIIKKWRENEVLAIEIRKDEKRKDREFIVAGPKAPPPRMTHDNLD